MESAVPVLAVELNTGRRLPCLYLRRKNGISTRIYSFDDFFHIKEYMEIFILKEDTEYVTLLRNLPFLAGTHSRRNGASIHRGELISNYAIEGPNQWPLSKLVKRITFHLPHAIDLMVNQATLKKAHNGRFKSETEAYIFSVAIDQLSINAYYVFSEKPYLGERSKADVRFCAEFQNGINALEVLWEISIVAQFISFSYGIPIHIEDVSISSLNNIEYLKSIDDNAYVEDSRLYFRSGIEAEIDPVDLIPYGAVALANDSRNRLQFEACLREWIRSYPEWRKANALMMETLTLRNEISHRRVMETCKWLEQIPSAQPLQEIPDEHANEIYKSALATATDLGHHDRKDRIRNAIWNTKSEAHNKRVERLIGMVQDFYGKGFLPENMHSHILHALKIRGQSAHAPLFLDTDKDFRKTSKAIKSVEALCVLLTGMNLPLTTAAKKRMRSHICVRNYVHAYAE